MCIVSPIFYKNIIFVKIIVDTHGCVYYNYIIRWVKSPTCRTERLRF